MSPHPHYRGRFAPSPTGPLHLGSLVAALGSWMMARRAGGEWWIRVEDLDPPREVPGAAERQLETLAAFGMVSDGPVMKQSTREADYTVQLQKLLDAGLAFPCRCSRSQLTAAGGIHRRCLAEHRDETATQVSIRLRVPERVITFLDELAGPQSQALADAVGDFVLRRADGCWAYQFAVVVDDAAQGITHVVRGADLLDSTPRQIHLQRCLGLPTPHYAHLPLVLDEDGNKLSKSLRSLPVDGTDPWPALRTAWGLLGQDESALRTTAAPGSALVQAIAAFDPARIPTASAAAVSGTSPPA
ncbi:tRNA glutamyl-Q(34) synthetase GluQRS [Arenimonas sp. MALMAid1274]|uniref:tRNA glutamyl-Q(34) synthetase GluQRS n=1 Tax=Arenimonas sp. MALMAid1274 TaxID=3411630 RepID=UPI003B9E65B5